MTPALILFQDERSLSPERCEQLLQIGDPIWLVTLRDHTHYRKFFPASCSVVERLDADSMKACCFDLPVSISGVGTFCESLVHEVAALASDYKYPGTAGAGGRFSSSDKWAMRARLHEAGVSAPSFISCASSDIPESGPRLPWPTAVLKPRRGEGGIGVVKIGEGGLSWNAAYNLSKRMISKAKTKGYALSDHEWLLEEFISGTLISVDGFVMDRQPTVLGIVESRLLDAPYFTIAQNLLPSSLSEDVEIRAKDLACAAVRALNFTAGPFHCEMRIRNGKPYLIEIAARLPGGQIPAAYGRSMGLDLVRIQVDLWLGRHPKLTPQSRIPILQRGVFPLQAGRIESIACRVDQSELLGVWDFVVPKRSGETVSIPPDLHVPLYYFAVEGLTPLEVEVLADSVESAMAVQLTPL